jgi:hypothetical protein
MASNKQDAAFRAQRNRALVDLCPLPHPAHDRLQTFLALRHTGEA